MIAELLGMAGSGALGTLIGVYEKSQANKFKAIQLKRVAKSNDSKALIDHLIAVQDKPFHGISTFLLVSTVCLCAILCINEPSMVLWTFNPDSAPTKFDFLFIHWESSKNQVYEITSGGIAYALLHAMVLQVGRVVSGVR
jgi:hypothetical protein